MTSPPRTPAPAPPDDSSSPQAMQAPSSRRDRPAPPRRTAPLALAGLCVVAVLLAAVLGATSWWYTPSDLAVVTPGPTVDVRASLAATAADPDFAARDAAWLVTTVAAHPLSNPEALRHRLTGGGDLAPIDMAAQGDARVSAQLSMEYTKRLAGHLATALVTGAELPAHDQLHVVLLDAGTGSAAGPLRLSDVITHVDDQPASWARYHAATQRLATDPTATATLRLLANGAPPARTEHVTAADLDGARVMPRLEQGPTGFDLTGVTGGSGGLVMTLAAIDATFAGDLAVLGSVAGTGAVDPSGRVLAVHGAPQKARAAAADGAVVFFYPTLSPATPDPDRTPGMQLVAVDHVTDALAWLCEAGATDGACTRD